MRSSSHLRRKIGVVAIAATISILVGFVFSSGRENLGNPSSESQLSGQARLVSIEPLPETDGPMCQWLPASTSHTLYAALWQEQAAARAATPDGDVKRAEVAQRRPLRTIGDPSALFSAVGVDPIRDEVVLQDENHFRILVYDRTTNTPPGATMSEPKRFIGGDRTNLALNCAIYIDPKNGDIYSVNNDSMDSTVIFSHQTEGNAPPDRKLETPHGTFGIAVDAEKQEMFLTVEHSHAVVVFSKMAKDSDSPIRTLQGDRTGLADPHGIALDTKDDLIFVSNFGSTMTMRRAPRAAESYGRRAKGKEHWPLDRDDAIPGSGRNLPASITVYSKNASGDTAPLRVIQGPKTQLNWPAGMAIDSERGELYVANDMGDSVLVFSTSANGDASPIRVLKGPKTLLKYPNGVTLDLVNDELWVANFGNHAATVYKRDASGDTPPLRAIRSGPLNAKIPALGNPFPVAFDTKRGEILVPN
jgi:DNA-binding beta-propeller fold protein YncE